MSNSIKHNSLNVDSEYVKFNSKESTEIFTLHEQSMNKNSNKKIIYNKWSETYDQYVDLLNYSAPQHLVKMCLPFLSHLNSSHHLNILDFGCGTGLLGTELKKQFSLNTNLTGIDISEGMINECWKKNEYDKLFNIDITVNKYRERYSESEMLINSIGGCYFDVIICCGVFLEGHINVEIITELLCTLVNKPGYICFSIRDSYYKENDAFFKNIEKTHKFNILKKQKISYLENVDAWGFILEVEV
tara:strand:- start:1604 stop:2338 length:735 start_codon:yes stop_codon:yes gene_type:complete